MSMGVLQKIMRYFHSILCAPIMFFIDNESDCFSRKLVLFLSTKVFKSSLDVGVLITRMPAYKICKGVTVTFYR